MSAFVALIDAQPDMTVVARGADGQQAVDLSAGHEPDVLLMDLRMPVLDGVEATRRIVASGGPTRVLVLTTFNVDELVTGALAAGARGFLLKDAEPEAVLDGIRAVHAGRAVLDPAVAEHVVGAMNRAGAVPHADERLTAREVDVLSLIAEGLTNSEIAQRLVVAETTVKTHVGNLLMKLGARDRVALVVLAYAMGLADPVRTAGRLPG
ncbi:response regulator transcription factor [Mariniluteicoccus endophyticus]